MYKNSVKDISKFTVTGINYKKTDATTRGQFAINNDQYVAILDKAALAGINELFILSTCNRTEIYSFSDDVNTLIELLCSETSGSEAIFRSSAYIKKGIAAIQHLFEVAAGVDSQILGDYEIVGQIKTAVKLAREKNCINTFTERLVNSVLQSSKAIKNQTALSGGTVSVSFAAVQYIKENIENIAAKRILLVGLGKIGHNTCKNMVDYLDTTNITLINRTEEKATLLASEMELRQARMEDLNDEITAADVIVVATNATAPIIDTIHLVNKGNKLVIDLSIPYNVSPDAKQLSGITLINIDELSKLKDETLAKREAELPQAMSIIAEHAAEFMEWYDMRKYVPVLKAVKIKLREIHSSPLYIGLYPESPLVATDSSDRKIQRVINGLASRMRLQNQQGCHYIQAINEFIATGSD